MPIDPSIALQVQPPKFNNPFEVLAHYRAQQDESELRRQQIASGRATEAKNLQDIEAQRRAEAAQQVFFNIVKTSTSPDEIEQRIRTEAPEMLDGYLKQKAALDEKKASIDKTNAEIKKLKQQAAKDGLDYAQPYMQLVEKAKYDPDTFKSALGLIKGQFGDFPAEQLWQQSGGTPDGIKAIVDAHKSTAQQSADAAALKAPDERRVLAAKAAQDERTLAGTSPEGLTAAQQEAGKPKTLDAAILAARNNGPELKRLLELKAKESAAGRDPRVTRYQSKDVLNDEGKPVMANFDAVSGKYLDPVTNAPIKNPKPVPSAQERMDSRKFEKSAPVLSAIGELSEKINTGSGLLAKAKGAAEKVAAKANYDDDVAEYQALVSGFTPLVARSLGHTGVLTQQDVDSVKELFPKPGDSKTLRDRKVGRLMKIVGELEGTEGVGGVAPKSGDVIEFVRDPKTGKLVRK